jgi:hypothetical protein
MGERTRRPTAGAIAGNAYDQITNNANGAAADMLGVTPAPAAPVLGAISMAQGGEQLGQGAARVAEGDSTGWVDVAGGAGGGIAGGIGVAHGLGAAMSWFGQNLTLAYLAGESTASGVGLMQAGGAITSATTGGTAAAGLGTAVGSAGALPVMAAVGAGAAGGIALAQRGQSYIAETGLLGQNSDGSGKSWSDWAGDGAWEDREAWADLTGNETVADIAGYTSLAGRTVVGAAGAAVTGVSGLVTDGAGLVADGASWAWDKATGW